jgi:hypothetical protein
VPNLTYLLPPANMSGADYLKTVRFPPTTYS